jgi:hypothetical protein
MNGDQHSKITLTGGKKMQDNLTVTFRHVPHSHELMHHIENEANRLHKRHCSIESCKVIVEQPHRRHRSGNSLCAKVLICVPGGRLFSSRETSGEIEPEVVRNVVSAAFGAIEDSVVRSLHRHNKPRHHRYRMSLSDLEDRQDEQLWNPPYDTSS